MNTSYNSNKRRVIMDFLEVKKNFSYELTEKVLPFWLKHGMDSVNGGIYTL